MIILAHLPILLFVLLALGGCERAPAPADETKAAAAPASVEQPPARRYVGSEACRGCHTQQFADWRESHHFKAMMLAGPQTVSGDFSSARFDYFGDVSEFFTEDGRYFVRARNAEGVATKFEISHTFGVAPLQQYLVTLNDGRRQALGIAADTRNPDAKAPWFHLYPEQPVMPGDRLHFTGADQNWNYMCADCHSTDLRKNYDADTDSYATTFAEMSVGCEACHGPGSGHIEQIAGGQGAQDVNAGFAVALNSPVSQVETCARCHARRGILAEAFEPGVVFMDYYRPALLDEPLYHPDGQILDEVYVYGSFLQSKMYRRGVRCSDCHSGHDAGRDIASNETCTQCHQLMPPARFPTLTARDYTHPEHHFHPPESDGAQCVSCHMPTQTYMGVDARHDHSLRVPRPDMSEQIGVPNACNACHDDKSPAWAAGEIAARYPAPRPAHYGAVIAAGRRGDAAAGAELAALAADLEQSAMVRATALSLLAGYPTAGARAALVVGLRDADPLVRLGALRGMESVPLTRRWLVAGGALRDPVLAVRMAAVTLLAPAPIGSRAQRASLAQSVEEFVSVQRLNADRAEAHASIGYVLGATGDRAGARRAYEKALRLDPGWAPALVNIADLNREDGRDADSGVLFERALASEPDSAEVHHAFGMWQVRTGRADEAVTSLAKAAALAPGSARYVYVYAVALNSTGQGDEALAQLRKAHEAFPRDADILLAMATMHRDRGEREAALRYARRLLALRPGEPGIVDLVEGLRER